MVAGRQICFWVEMLVAAIIPAVLLSFKGVRNSIAGLAVCSSMTVIGMVMNRIDLSIVTFLRPDGMRYFPTWIELAVSVGIVSAAALAFIYFAENYKVYEEHRDEEPDLTVFARPRVHSSAWFGGIWNRAPRRYSLTAVAGAALTIGFLPRESFFKFPISVPVPAAHTIMMKRTCLARMKRGISSFSLLWRQARLLRRASLRSLRASRPRLCCWAEKKAVIGWRCSRMTSMSSVSARNRARNAIT